MSVQTISAASTFDSMKATLEMHAELLTSYTEDFYVCDKSYLEHTWHEGAQYCWLVRESGTHLTLLNVHHKLCSVEQTEAAIECCGGPYAIFHVKDGRISAIDKQRALQLLAADHVTYNNCKIAYKGRDLASYRVDSYYDEAEHRHVYDTHLDSQGAVYSMGDLMVLRETSIMIARLLSQTLFAPLSKITLDSEQLGDVIRRRQNTMM